MLEITRVVYPEDVNWAPAFETALRQLVGESRVHHVEDEEVRLTIAREVKWIPAEQLEDPDVARERFGGQAVLGRIEPAVARSVEWFFEPVFSATPLRLTPWTVEMFLDRYRGVRCYRIDDLGRPTEFADVPGIDSSYWRLAGSGDHSYPMDASVVSDRHVEGNVRGWSIAALARRITDVDPRHLPHATYPHLSVNEVRDIAFSYEVREVPVSKLREQLHR